MHMDCHILIIFLFYWSLVAIKLLLEQVYNLMYFDLFMSKVK